MLRYFFILALVIISQLVHSQTEIPSLLPMPQSIDWQADSTNIGKVSLSTNMDEEVALRMLSSIGCDIVEKSDVKVSIQLVQNISDTTVNPHESYKLRAQDDYIQIEAVTEQGVFWALQTMRQLARRSDNGVFVRDCEIVDWPAFRIRGFMHDVGRGFIPIDELKKQIELLSQFKINVFHWHLTEDIGWRLESKVFPELTNEKNFERLHGKSYTIEEAKELIQFCKEHHVLLIPEIDMPGHSAAFTRALGHDMQSEEGMKLLKQLMDEVCEVFADVPYIHIGTDEVRFTNRDFVPEMVDYIRAKGKKVISWNPGWKYKPGEIDMIQMWSSRGKLHPGIPAIDSRLHYINHFDTFADIVGLFHSNVAGVSEGNKDVAGSIIAAWNDRYVESVDQITAENGFYPSMLTLAESTWKGGREKYFYEQGLKIGDEQSDDYKSFSDFEERMLYFKGNVFKNEPFAYVRQTNVKWHITDPFPNKGKLNKTFPPERKIQAEYQYMGKTFKSYDATGAGIYLRHTWGTLIPAFYDNPQENHTAYAYTWVHSPKNQEAGIYVRFQNYGRSEKDLPPPKGKWDYKESQIWINDEAIQPPVWTNTHTKVSNEVSLQNENWEGRLPIKVQLKQGWNKVLLKMPVGKFKSDEVRLVKWMFNAVFVTSDGRNALENIIYSPDKIINE